LYWGLVTDPSPAWLSSYTPHLRDTCGEQASERSCERRSRKEDGCSDTEFRTFVPTTQIVVDTREQPSLSTTKPETLHTVSIVLSILQSLLLTAVISPA
jgi:hypothetical protein